MMFFFENFIKKTKIFLFLFLKTFLRFLKYTMYIFLWVDIQVSSFFGDKYGYIVFLFLVNFGVVLNPEPISKGLILLFLIHVMSCCIYNFKI